MKRKPNIYVLLIVTLLLFFAISTFPTNRTDPPTSSLKTTDIKPTYLAEWDPNGTQIYKGDPLENTDIAMCSDDDGGAIMAWGRWPSGDLYAQHIASNGTILWKINGTEICTANGSCTDIEICSDAAGGAIITWRDSRSGVSDYDIYAQRIASNGTTLWALNGTIVCSAENDQIFPQIASDGLGGAVIAWHDGRNVSESHTYAQRIAPNGTTLWTPNGTKISTPDTVGETAHIASDGAGGAFVTWAEFAQGILVQKINATGNLQWPSGGVALTANYAYNPKVCHDDAGGALVAWERDAGGSTHDIYLQWVNSTGSTQWPAEGVPIATTINDEEQIQLLSDGLGNLIVVWRSDAGGTGDKIYTQKINSTGAKQWASSGIRVSQMNSMQDRAQICTDEAGGLIIVWSQFLDETTDYDIYCQRINSTGQRKYGSFGIAVCTEIYGQFNPQICKDNSGGSIISWGDERFISGTANTIFVQRIKNEIPTANHLSSITTDRGENETIDWILWDDGGNGQYRVLINDTQGNSTLHLDWNPWANDTPLLVPINRTSLGLFQYILEYIDDQNVNGVVETVLVAIVNDPPDILCCPLPADTAENVNTSPYLCISAEDTDGDLLNISFYNATADTLIGTVLNVPSGESACILWADLAYQTTYEWYVEVSDGVNTTRSSKWQFTTETPPKKGIPGFGFLPCILALIGLTLTLTQQPWNRIRKRS